MNFVLTVSGMTALPAQAVGRTVWRNVSLIIIMTQLTKEYEN